MRRAIPLVLAAALAAPRRCRSSQSGRREARLDRLVQSRSLEQPLPSARRIPLPSDNPLEVLPVFGNVYMVARGPSNVAVQIGDEGVLLVDAATAALSDRVLEAVRALSDGPAQLHHQHHLRPRALRRQRAPWPCRHEPDDRAARPRRAGFGARHRQPGRRRQQSGPAASHRRDRDRAREPAEPHERRAHDRAVRDVADQHVLHREEDDVVQRRADRDPARARRRTPTATCWCSSGARTWWRRATSSTPSATRISTSRAAGACTASWTR